MKFQYYNSGYIQEPDLDGYEDFSGMQDQVSATPDLPYSYFKVPGFAFPLKLSIAKLDIISDDLGKHAKIVGAVSVPNDNLGALSHISFPLNGDNSWTKIRAGALLTINSAIGASNKNGDYFGFGMGSNYQDDPNESKARSMQGGVFVANSFVLSGSDPAFSEYRTSFGSGGGFGQYLLQNTTTDDTGSVSGSNQTSDQLRLIGENNGSLRDIYFEIDRTANTFKFFIGTSTSYSTCSISEFKDRMKVNFGELNLQAIAGMSYIDLLSATNTNLKDITITCFDECRLNIEAIAYKLF